MTTSLTITETFVSLQGESDRIGLPTFFIRLTGCKLRCSYCDTEHAYEGGEKLSIDELVTYAENSGVCHVCITGGEPLLQDNVFRLMTRLCDLEFDVTLETGGSESISSVDPRVTRIIDLKTPDSGEHQSNRYENIHLLRKEDQMKFVICSKDDYEWARSIISEYELEDRCQILMSPVTSQLKPADLAQWILNDHLNVRFQLQLHKLIWPDEERGR